jgi:ATP-binding protein involved in chromosome partitioning
MIWRGPMVASTIKTFTNKVLWKDIDFLIIDMPPGTGDALLTFSQEIDIDGAIIITTPQEISIIDVKRGIKMFEQTNVKIIGIIENMKSFVSDDGKEYFIFGKEGGKKIANEFNLDLLGQIPLDVKLREQSDMGEPYMEKYVNDKTYAIFLEIAKKIINILEQSSKK